MVSIKGVTSQRPADENLICDKCFPQADYCIDSYESGSGFHHLVHKCYFLLDQSPVFQYTPLCVCTLIFSSLLTGDNNTVVYLEEVPLQAFPMFKGTYYKTLPSFPVAFCHWIPSLPVTESWAGPGNKANKTLANLNRSFLVVLFLIH